MKKVPKAEIKERVYEMMEMVQLGGFEKRYPSQLSLKRLQKKLNITFIYVTHDQEEALTMSDRIAVMHDGVIDQLALIFLHDK